MIERYIAIDNVCAWPNLTRLPDGAIIATIFNQPCHLQREGDVECWASTDGGKIWRYRGTPALHEPRTNRGNVAAGLARNGDLIVLASGYKADAPSADNAEPTFTFSAESLLAPLVCRSVDKGATWYIGQNALPAPLSGYSDWVPFGDVLAGEDGELGVAVYCSRAEPAQREDACNFLRSLDDGRTWQSPVLIAEDHNETAILHLARGHWLAAARARRGGRLDLFRSDDNGQSWRFDQVLTLPRQHPAHLLRLSDGRILLSYSVRCAGDYGLYVRMSDDEGYSWQPPIALLTYPDCDSGYPSSVQNEDGSIVTAYYSSSVPQHQRYHMGVARWRVEDGS